MRRTQVRRWSAGSGGGVARAATRDGAAEVEAGWNAGHAMNPMPVAAGAEGVAGLSSDWGASLQWCWQRGGGTPPECPQSPMDKAACGAAMASPGHAKAAVASWENRMAATAIHAAAPLTIRMRS